MCKAFQSRAGLPVQQGTRGCHLKAEVVAAGALAAREGPPGGEAAVAWVPGPAEHPSGAARLAGRPRENLEKHLGEHSARRAVSTRDGAPASCCKHSVLKFPVCTAAR